MAMQLPGCQVLLAGGIVHCLQGTCNIVPPCLLQIIRQCMLGTAAREGCMHQTGCPATTPVDSELACEPAGLNLRSFSVHKTLRSPSNIQAHRIYPLAHIPLRGVGLLRRCSRLSLCLAQYCVCRGCHSLQLQVSTSTSESGGQTPRLPPAERGLQLGIVKTTTLTLL